MIQLEAHFGEALTEDCLAHAYLLVGEGGELVVRQLLLRLYCERGTGCRECPSCQKIAHGAHPDARRLEKGGARIGIDQIREVQTDARYEPLESSRKVYVIPEAGSLSLEAANSLLKILEAPPPYVTFLLLAHSPQQLLPTIVSRCQVVRLKPLSTEEIQRELQTHGLGGEEISYLLAVVRGAPDRWTRLLAEDHPHPLAERDEVLAEISELAPLEILKVFAEAERLIAEREAALALVLSLGKLQPHEILELAQALAKLPPERIEFFIREAARWHRDLLVIATGQDQDEAPIFATDHREELRGQSARWSTEQLAESIAALERVSTAIHGNANVQLLLESLLLRLAR
jgi:DNA polymerase-3 subunit delta'